MSLTLFSLRLEYIVTLSFFVNFGQFINVVQCPILVFGTSIPLKNKLRPNLTAADLWRENEGRVRSSVRMLIKRVHGAEMKLVFMFVYFAIRNGRITVVSGQGIVRTQDTQRMGVVCLSC